MYVFLYKVSCFLFKQIANSLILPKEKPHACSISLSLFFFALKIINKLHLKIVRKMQLSIQTYNGYNLKQQNKNSTLFARLMPKESSYNLLLYISIVIIEKTLGNTQPGSRGGGGGKPQVLN